MICLPDWAHCSTLCPVTAFHLLFKWNTELFLFSLFIQS